MFQPLNRWALTLSVVVLLCATGCDRLGIRFGKRNLPDPKPVDQGVLSKKTNSKIKTAEFEKTPTEPSANLELEIKPYTEWTMSEMAADALGRIGEASVESLVQSLDDENPFVRERAARILARIGPDAVAAVPKLIRRLHDSELAVRLASARALGQIGPQAKEAVPDLIRVLEKGAQRN